MTGKGRNMSRKRKNNNKHLGLKVTALMLAFVCLAVVMYFRASAEEPVYLIDMGREVPTPNGPTAAPISAGEKVGEQIRDPVVVAPVITPETNIELKPPVETTPEPQPEYFTLTLVGDCTLWSNKNYANHPAGYAGVINGDPAYPFSNTFQYTGSDDCTLANLECILSDKTLTVDYTAATFAFVAPSEYATIMTAGGVDYVTIANNHIMDCYERGLEETKASLEANAIPYGAECDANIIETPSGLKIGIYTAGVNMRPDWKTDTAVNAVKSLREQGAEYVVCMFHWGNELYYSPFQYQIDLAHACVDAGADLIYGSHSHCLQPIEEYNGTPIFYSLGNWTFGGHTAPTDPDTALIQVKVKRDLDGKVSTEDYDIVPCCVSSNIDGALSKAQNYNNYCPTPYPEDCEAYSRVLAKLDGSFEPTSQGADYSNWYASLG